MAVAEQAAHVEKRKFNPLQLVPYILILGLAAYLYRGAIQWWYFEWTMDGSYYAHAVFIPFFVGAMFWKDRERLRRIPLERSWWGILPLFLSALLVVYAKRGEVTVVLSFSFMFYVIGASLIMAGGRFTRAIFLPLVFIFSVIPVIPNRVFSVAAFPIQMTSTKLAAFFLNLFGFSVERFGTSIKMESYRMEVEVACSGFKTLIGLLSFAGAFAYLVEGALWKRWFIFLIAAPLSILINGVRITLIGIVGELFSTNAAHSFHDYSGFIVLVLGFMFLFSLARIIKCQSFIGIPLEDTPVNDSRKPTGTGIKETTDDQNGKLEGEPALQTNAQIILAEDKYGPVRSATLAPMARGAYMMAACLGIMCLVQGSVRPMKADFPMLTSKDVPANLENGWQQDGPDVPITPVVQQTLQPDSYLDRNYRNLDGNGNINLFITGGNSRHTFHDPHDCFMGSGFLIKDLPVIKVNTTAGLISVQVSQVENPTTREKSLLMFLYVVDGRPENTIAGVETKTAIHSILGISSRPFYFVRFRQLGMGVDDVHRKQIISFISSVWPHIAPHVLEPK